MTKHRPRTLLVLLIALVVFAASCSDDTTETTNGSTTQAPSTSGPDAAALATLQPNIGCGDAVWSFSSPDGDLLVRVAVDGFLQSIADEGVVDRSYDLADAGSGASATLEVGTKLGITECNDVVEGDYEVRASWTATAGTVRIEVPEVPAAPLEICTTPVDTIITVDGVTFEVDGEEVSTEMLTLTGAVGWCAG